MTPTASVAVAQGAAVTNEIALSDWGVRLGLKIRVFREKVGVGSGVGYLGRCLHELVVTQLLLVSGESARLVAESWSVPE